MSEPAQLRHAENRADLAKCFSVMQQLRPHITGEADFIERAERQMTAGYRLLVASEDGTVIGLAGYRAQENLIYGPFVYVDDLVVAADARSSGIGAYLLDGVCEDCRRLDIPTLVLDTAIDNALGQRFYFRYGMLARGLHFKKQVAQ